MNILLASREKQTMQIMFNVVLMMKQVVSFIAQESSNVK
jgi:hypothetical protein